MRTVISKDGTSIAFDEYGERDVILYVTGALGTRLRQATDDLAPYLSSQFKLVSYDRRGRGDSGDTLPYAVQREIEDIEALIEAVGGSVYLYGISSGAVLALEAANALTTKIRKLALYEPPLIIDDSRPPVPADYVAQLNAATAAGRPGQAVEIFMTKALLIPVEFVNQMRGATNMGDLFEGEAKPPTWTAMEQVAHTLAYDGTILQGLMSGRPLPTNRWTSVTAPTQVIVGGSSEPFFHSGAQSLAGLLPNAEYRALPGQDHAVAPSALAPLLAEFFAG